MLDHQYPYDMALCAKKIAHCVATMYPFMKLIEKIVHYVRMDT